MVRFLLECQNAHYDRAVRALRVASYKGMVSQGGVVQTVAENDESESEEF